MSADEYKLLLELLSKLFAVPRLYCPTLDKVRKLRRWLVIHGDEVIR